MFEVVITIVLGAVFAVGAAWVAQHVLGTPIGWVRAIIFVAIIYTATVPIVRAALEAGDVMVDGQFVVSSPIGVVFIAVALGWQFALAVTVIMISELFWPSGRGWHPIRGVKELLHRRKRMLRYAQTLRIASKHGLSLFGSHRKGEDQDVPAAVVAAMNEAGVTFVKIGQVLSTRDDVLPSEFTDAFATLQMQTTPLPWDDAKAAIEAELPGTIDEVFAWVDEVPMAAASLAQVHAARLHPAEGETEGANVVIKIQRPDARASVQIDSDIIVRLAQQAERRAAWARAYGLNALAGEFVRSLKEELDYRIELANTELLRDTLARSSVRAVHVPEVYPALCTERMMVQERIEGIPFSNLDGGLPAAMADAEPRERTEEERFEVGDVAGTVSWTRPDPLPTAHEIADVLVDTVFEQIAVRGVFHADLHPGNIILRADGQIALIDFGSVGILERSMRRMLLAMMSAMGAEDDIALTDLLLMIAGEPADGSELDRRALQHEIGVILTRVHNGRTDASIFTEVIDVLRRHQLALPPALILVFRTIASMEGSLRRLVPDYDMVDQALTRTTYFARLAFDPRDMLADARVQLQVVGEQLRRLPRRIEAIGAQFENGTFGMSLRMFRDPNERSWIASLVGQLTTALVGVVLVIAAVVLVVFGGGPLLTPDVSLFPFLGAVLGLGGMLLVLRSLRTALMRGDTPAGR
ncbi:ABC1 kinase family protein [Microbacterium sp. NPDC055910]|uniref:ABC1 kinase family protein n=1 Tax=Microbacterium sp. NPDC055910 TaxID=3345659 RepID=UPI0035DFDA46